MSKMSGENTARMSSVLGPTAVVIGNVRGAGDLEVRGRIQGSVELNGRLLIADGGLVLGDIEATQVTVAGEVRGSLIAGDGVSIASSGRVEGDITAPRVGIEAGARVRGLLRTGGELPDRNELVKTALDSPSADTSEPVMNEPSPLPRVAAAQAAAPSAQEIAPQPQAPQQPSPQPRSPQLRSPQQRSPQQRSPQPRSPQPQSPQQRSPQPQSPQQRARQPRPPAPPVSEPPTHIQGASSAEHDVPAKPAPLERARPRATGGPPRVPTFEKGAKPRPRT